MKGLLMHWQWLNIVKEDFDMKNLFNRTKKWNEMCGVKTPNTFQWPTVEDMDLMKDLAQEEAQEMRDADSKSDALDAMADQQFVLFGNVARLGLTWDEFEGYLKKVIKSNESKFAKTEQEAQDSVKKEAERLGISEEKISYLQLDGKFVIFNSESGKILKSVNYLPPEQM